MVRKILVGSRHFFWKIAGYKSKDSDYVYIVGQGKGFEYIMQVADGSICRFEVVKRPVPEMIAYTLRSGDPLQIGKFLVPEFAEAIGATVEDIAPLEPLLDKLDAKHAYEAYIFRAVQGNGTFTLTDEQRKEAYRIYTEARKETNPENKHQ